MTDEGRRCVRCRRPARPESLLCESCVDEMLAVRAGAGGTSGGDDEPERDAETQAELSFDTGETSC